MNELTTAKKILVTDLMHIGDIVFITPFLHALRKNAPEAQITLLVDQKTQDVVRYNSNIDVLMTIDKKGKDDNLRALWNFSSRLRKEHYDVVINLHSNERCSFLAAFSGARVKVGVCASVFRLWFDKVLEFNLDRQVQVVDMYLDILRHMGVTDLSHIGTEMYGIEKEATFAANFYEENGIMSTDRIIGINVGGSWPTKRWTNEGFAAVADHYLEQGLKVVFFGGPMDTSQVEAITGQMKHTPALATGKTSLLQLAALIKRCNVFISGDSGPMHIATTQHVPIVAIYGPSDWIKFPPFGDNKVIITAGLECQPCGAHQCEHHGCMKKILLQAVITAVDRFVKY